MASPVTDVRTSKDSKVVFDDVLVLRMTNAQINPTTSETTWGDSDSEGFTLRKGARRDCTGSVTGKFSTDKPIYDMCQVGDELKMELWENTTDYWAFPCVLVQNYTLGYNQDTKEVIEWNMAFGAVGRFYHPGEDGAPSETLPA